MKYWALAACLIAGFVWLSLGTQPSVRKQALAPAEENLRVRVVNPVFTRFDENGQIDSTLMAPVASDFSQAQASEIDQPTLQWPGRGWDATGDLGRLVEQTTQLIGNAEAQNPEKSQRLTAPRIDQTGPEILAPQGRFTGPDFTGRAEQVTINTDTQVITLSENVETLLWPAR